MLIIINPHIPLSIQTVLGHTVSIAARPGLQAYSRQEWFCIGTKLQISYTATISFAANETI
jgi:hypothetical protein